MRKLLRSSLGSHVVVAAALIVLAAGAAFAKSGSGGNTCKGEIVYGWVATPAPGQWVALSHSCTGNCVQPTPNPRCVKWTFKQNASGNDLKVCVCAATTPQGVPTGVPWVDLASAQVPMCDAVSEWPHNDDPYHVPPGGTPTAIILCSEFPCPTGAGTCQQNGSLPATGSPGEMRSIGCECKQ